MASFLDFDGVYADGQDGRPLRMFVIHNDTDEDFENKWAGKSFVIKAGEMKECGHAEAFFIVKALTDREMFKKAAKAATEKEKERLEMQVLSPHERKPYEDRFLQEIKPNEESPIMRKLREDAEKKVREEMSSASDAAAGVTSTPKRGRPRKEEAFADK